MCHGETPDSNCSKHGWHGLTNASKYVRSLDVFNSEPVCKESDTVAVPSKCLCGGDATGTCDAGQFCWASDHTCHPAAKPNDVVVFDSNMKGSFGLSKDKKSVHMTVTLAMSGWVAVGVSPQGGMTNAGKGADIISCR